MNNLLLELPYLPNINWLKNFVQHETVVLEREENFVKSSYRNRCEIAGANGKLSISIPIKGGRDHHQLYKAVRIDNTKPWQKTHWQSMQSAYGSSPYFEFYFERIQPFYEKEYDLLFDFNYELLKAVLKVLKTEKEIAFTTEFEKEVVGIIDLRKNKTTQTTTRYNQPFEERHGFIENLCALDLIFNLGPQAGSYLKET